MNIKNTLGMWDDVMKAHKIIEGTIEWTMDENVT